MNDNGHFPVLSIFLWLLALVVVTTTLLPLSYSVRWWVRMWDFPRLHIAILAMVTLLAAIPFAVLLKPLLISLMLAAIIYQSVQIFPYTPFAPTEIDLVDATEQDGTVSLLSVNVLMENTRHSDLIKIIQREDPDVLLLMETDEVWHSALESELARYATVKKHVSDDHYGLIFATRLDHKSVDIVWPEQDDTPALKAELIAPTGATFNFIGLHPRPPVPGNNSKVRDKQIKDAAKWTSSWERPTVCMGDFNDVAWSWTARRFKRYGEFLEPRVGRGMLSSFHAKYYFIRVPIDQLYLTKSVGLVSFARLEYFGSDHFPVMATVLITEAGANSS